MSTPPGNILFVGIGSPHGDDQVGWRIADALADDPPEGVNVRKAAVPTCLFDMLDGVDRVVIADACRSGQPAGTVRRFEWEREHQQQASPVIPDLARFRMSGSHAFGLTAVLDLASRLGRLPPRVVVYGIEGGVFEPGNELSPELEDRLPALVAQVRNELSHARILAGTIAADPG